MNTSLFLLECRELARPGAPGGSALLQGITLRLRAGDRCGMVGKSGSGKSLLLRGLARLDARTTGSVMYREQTADALGVPRFRKHVMYVTQHSTLLPGTVEENLRIPFQLAGRRGESFDRDAMIAQLRGLARDEAFLDKPVSELSGGEARLVTLLRAIQLKANVLLLDEPTSSLDDETARAVETLIGAWINAASDRAYLWVTHSLGQARRVSDCVWEMRGGQLRELPEMSDAYIDLQSWQVASAAALVLVNAAISFKLQLGLERRLAVASARTVTQLLLVGLVLHWVFELSHLAVIAAIMALMTVVAGVTAWQSTGRRYPGMLGNIVVSIWGSSWLILAFTMVVVFRQTQPWYDPQYAIPLLGMILGNTLNGVTLGLGTTVDALSTRQHEVETLLALCATRWEAARGLIQQAVKVGMIPIINSMMVVGLVSLPGMMTGQLLSGVEPLAAVRYQIVIMFVISSATAIGVVSVVLLTFLRISNSQHQFRFDEIVEVRARRA